MWEHGSFTLEVIDQTLIVKCFDAWNIETVIRMCKEYKECIEKIYDKPWACMVDLTQWELSPPQMWEEIDTLNRWGNSNNQKYEAVICSLSIQKSLMQESHSVLTNVESKFFENIEEATRWLKSVGVLTAT